MMRKFHSFTAAEKQILPKFRTSLKRGKNVGEIQDNFKHTVVSLIDTALQGDEDISIDDIDLKMDGAAEVEFSRTLTKKPKMKDLLMNSDLIHVIGRFARATTNQCTHLQSKKSQTKNKKRVR